MEELSKKDILTLIGENITSIRHSGYEGFDEGVELEEMPQDPKDFPSKIPDPDKPTKKSRGELPKWTRLYALDSEGKPKEHVGWFGRNPETQASVPIIFTCEWEELVAKYPDLVPKLKEKFGSVNLVEDECRTHPLRGDIDSYGIKPIPGSDEVVKVTGTQYTPSVDDEGNFKTTYTREKINRVFNKVLENKLQSEDTTNALKKLSLPKIVINDSQHRNSRSTVNDEEIRFESHNINLYEKQSEFVAHVVNAVRNPDPDTIPEKGDRHVRRIYNNVYSNWSRTRFTQSSGYGKTPVFQLDKGDFPNEQNFEVMVSADVKVIGKALEKNENNEVLKWGWEITYLAEYAKKAPTDRVARKLNKDLEISKSVSVDLSEPKKFDGWNTTDDQGHIEDGDRGNNHPLTDVNIMGGLNQVLDDFINEIKNTNPQSAVVKAVTRVTDTGDQQRFQGNLNEDKIREIVKKVVSENK